MPGEYAAIGHPQGPEPFEARPTSSRPPRSSAGSSARAAATSSRGPQVAARARRALRAAARRRGVFADFRAAEDPEAPVTVLGSKRFPYQAPPKKLAKGRARSPARLAQAERSSRDADAQATSARAGGLLAGLLAFPKAASNALLVSARESAERPPADGRRAAGRLLQPADPDGGGRPRAGRRRQAGDRRRGASFVGINLYVQLGRGRDYAWSATSAGQDIIDTFARPDLRRRRHALPSSAASACRSRCSSAPTRWHADAAATRRRRARETLRAERTKLGIVAGRGDRPRQAGALHQAALDLLPRGRLARPASWTSTRPRQITGPRDFQRAARDDRLHVQLVLRRRRAHRLLQLRREPGAREGHRPQLPGRARSSSGRAGTRTPGRRASRGFDAAPAGRSTRRTSCQLEQQAGARLPRRRRRTRTRPTYRSVLLEDRLQARGSRASAR